ncbi:MAG: hypothetical protein K2W92_07090 [Alphaproteobacteria bacterium]|nr:hypothetical protein [Alphaproteobacteria bacterium]
MFRKMSFLTFCLAVVLSTRLYAGWPEDGWEGVPSLRVVHKGQTINFDELHQHLATEEERIARILPANDPKNIVLASVSFLGGDSPSLHTYLLKTQEKKWLVFESGWASSFIPHPVYDQAQRLMKPYAPKLQKEDLTLAEQKQLVQDCIKIAQDQYYFEEQVRPNFYFFDYDPTPIEYILERAEKVFAGAGFGDPHKPIYDELTKNRAAFIRLASDLQDTKHQAAQRIRVLTQHIDSSSSIDLGFINELSKTATSFREVISKKEKELSSIGSKVISTYWHSEQKLLKYIEDSMSGIIAEICGGSLPFKPEAIVINIHSRHDICPVCSHAFVRSYTHPEGILSTFKAALSEKLAIDFQILPLYITSSFREQREKTKYSVREDRPDILEDSVKTVYPAFPTLHVPLSPSGYSQSPGSSSSSSSSS